MNSVWCISFRPQLWSYKCTLTRRVWIQGTSRIEKRSASLSLESDALTAPSAQGRVQSGGDRLGRGAFKVRKLVCGNKSKTTCTCDAQGGKSRFFSASEVPRSSPPGVCPDLPWIHLDLPLVPLALPLGPPGLAPGSPWTCPWVPLALSLGPPGPIPGSPWTCPWVPLTQPLGPLGPPLLDLKERQLGS